MRLTDVGCRVLVMSMAALRRGAGGLWGATLADQLSRSFWNSRQSFAAGRAACDEGIHRFHGSIIKQSELAATCRFNDQPDLHLCRRTLMTATRRVKMDFFVSSPGMIVEPYKPPPPPLPIMERWFTKQGWRIRKKNFMDMLKTAYALAKVKQKNKGYTQKMFYRETSDLYKEINTLSAAGDLGKLRRLVTENFFSVMKNQIKQREAAWSRVHWEIVGPLKLIRTLQARMVGLDKDDVNNAFVQVTIRIRSHQIFAAYDKKGKQVTGDLEKPLLVEDIWVFEKHLTRPQSVWRLCGQIKI